MAAKPASASRDTVRFYLDGELVELRGVEATRSVLQYLREDLRRTGSKEGCAEGDCGACTVVVAEADGDEVRLSAINSCIQFLPTLDGKALFTVESLQADGMGLHPVQRAMVDCHGSQCGFCTPGFVMSLFALYKNNPAPTRVAIDDALAGNLCRCTGYRPIIEAATQMYEFDDAGSDWIRQSCRVDRPPAGLAENLRALHSDQDLAVVTDGSAFFAPSSSAALARLLDEHDDATILAGGTDVGLWVTKQYRELATIIYTGRVEEMLRIEQSDTHLEIGAAVTLSAAMPQIVDCFPGVEEVMLRFASPPIRNAGTLGGNVANGSPIGDSMPWLMVAGASIVLCSAAGTRELALEDFYQDYQVKDLRAGEFVETLRIPLPGPDTQILSYKLSKRFDQDISAVCSAYRLQLEDGRVADFAMACGGLAAIIKRATHCEQAVIGQPWNEQTLAAGQQALQRDFAPISDMRATADYRLKACKNLLRRCYLETAGETGLSVYRYGRQG